MTSSEESLGPCGQGCWKVDLSVLPAEAVQGGGGFCQSEAGTVSGGNTSGLSLLSPERDFCT